MNWSLVTELNGILLCFKQMCAPATPTRDINLVDLVGYDPTTTPTGVYMINHVVSGVPLNKRSIAHRIHIKLVEVTGLEPATFCVQSRRSPW